MSLCRYSFSSCSPLPSSSCALLIVSSASAAAAFAQRRKTLRSALSGWAGSPAYAERVLKKARVDPTARGEVLTVEDYSRIAAALEAIDAAEHG